MQILWMQVYADFDLMHSEPSPLRLMPMTKAFDSGPVLRQELASVSKSPTLFAFKDLNRLGSPENEMKPKINTGKN